MAIPSKKFSSAATMITDFWKNKSFAVIGTGKLGTALLHEMAGHFSVLFAVDENPAALKNISQISSDIALYSSLEQIPTLPDVLFLAVNDTAIASLAQEFANFFGSRFSGKTVLHCSGSLSYEILSPLQAQGAHIGCIHPYQTLFRPSADIFSGCGWSVESDSIAEELASLVKIFGGNPIIFTNEQSSNKEVYHASAVVASNFLNAVISFAADLAKKADIPAEDFLLPIINKTIENNFANPETIPLTGPVARGDSLTLRKHLEALQQDTTDTMIYIDFFNATARMALKNQLISEKKYQEFREIIRSFLSDD